MLNKKQVRAMIIDILKEADYDLAKSFDPELSEDPKESARTMRRMIQVAAKHLAGNGGE